MVFEKITLFEPHFDGAAFDARFGGRDEPEGHETDEYEMDEHADVEMDDEGGRGIVGPVVALLALAVVATLMARRFLGGSDVDEQYELDESIEQAAD